MVVYTANIALSVMCIAHIDKVPWIEVRPTASLYLLIVRNVTLTHDVS